MKKIKTKLMILIVLACALLVVAQTKTGQGQKIRIELDVEWDGEVNPFYMEQARQKIKTVIPDYIEVDEQSSNIIVKSKQVSFCFE